MVLPIGDRNPVRSFPFVTISLIAINVAVFLFANLQLERPEIFCFVYRWSAVPVEVLNFTELPEQAVRQLGCPAGQVPDKSVLISIITSMFLHGGWGHLILNMLFLWVFGNNVEDELGHLPFLLYYLLGGVVAVYGFAVFHPNLADTLLGASGAIAAVLGGYLILHPRAPVHTYIPFPLYLFAFLVPRARLTAFFLIFAIMEIPAWAVLSFWFLTQLAALDQVQGAGGSAVAFEAHIAGFLAGLVLTLIFRGRSRPPPRRLRPGF